MSNNTSPRIQKFLAGWGLASRRMIENWIRQGRVLINKKPAKLGDTLRGEDEIIVLDVDRTVLYRATLRGVYDERSSRWLKRGFEYWAVNKPRGVLASTRDPHHKNMVTHLVPSSTRVFPVGRLDKESEGLILLTSDGDLCHRLTHPRFGVIKRYQVTLDWPVSEETIAAVEKGGVMLDEGPTLPAKVKVISSRCLELSMREGRKREIRRIFERFGHRVVRLVRVGFGPIELGDLPPGKALELTSDEVAALRRAVRRSHHSVENKATERVTRRPASGRPGQHWGLRSSRSSARRSKRKGSRS
ncbi:Ribosomal large subunit pseudouridine synthase B [subsurface metagenome]|nr:pseudouridine synthase [bacterium]